MFYHHLTVIWFPWCVFFLVLVSCVVAAILGSTKDVIGYIFTTEE